MKVSVAVTRALSLVGERSEQALMNRLTQVASELAGSWGSIGLLLGADGTPSVVAQSGLSRDQAAMMHLLPRPAGLLARVLEGSTVRLERWSELLGPHQLSSETDRKVVSAIGIMVGPFLGIPIVRAGEILGAVYLGRGPDAAPYTDDDVQAVEGLAEVVAQRLAEIRHKSAADLLIDRLAGGGSVRRTDDARTIDASFAIRRLLASARRVLGTESAALSKVSDDAVRITLLDHDSDDPPLLREGTVLDRSESLCALMVDGAIASCVPDLRVNPVTQGMSATQSLGLRSYCGVPVVLPDGAVYGSLSGFSRDERVISSSQVESLRVLANLVGIELGNQLEREVERGRALAEFSCSTQPSRRTIHLQPIVDLENGRPVGFEALTRFVDAYGNPRRPDVVFEEASQLGLGVKLEQDVATEALQLLPMIPDDCYLSVNLSPLALTAPGTFELLTDAVDDHPGRVIIELTEHEAVSDYPALLDVLDGIRGRGLRLAIDDTGAGYASLQHVTRMHPEIVKLDMAFVRDVHLDPRRRAVARALTTFAADVGANLIAEGIEYVEEADELIRIGACYGQGYLYGRPMPAAEAVATAGRSLTPS